MKKQFSFLLLIVLLCNNALGQSLSIQDAIAQKKIECTISGSWNRNEKSEFMDANGQYYGKCMNMKIRSKSTDTLYISIENGLMLMCDDTATQDMIITKPEFVYLYPRQSITFQLYAMCSEIHDGMPHQQTAYTIGAMAEQKLVSITHAIDDMFMHNIVGQGAIWSFTDNATEFDLRKYGATKASLEMTVAVLNRAGVKTLINPTAAKDPVETQTTMDSILEIVNHPVTIPETKNVIPLHPFIVYGGGSAIVLLLGTTGFLLFKKGKKNNDKNKMA